MVSVFFFLAFSASESVNQLTVKAVLAKDYSMPGYKWWTRKSDKFLDMKTDPPEPVYFVRHSKYMYSVRNGLLDGPEARFFAVFLNLYRTGGMYVDLTTMMLEPLAEVYMISSVVTCHCLIQWWLYFLPPNSYLQLTLKGKHFPSK